MSATTHRPPLVPFSEQPLRDWDDTLAEVLGDRTLAPCPTCYDLFLVEEDGVQDPEQVAWLGVHGADYYCSAECLEDAQERGFEHESGRGVK